MSNQGEYPEDNRVGKHEPHDLSLTRRDLIKVSAATAATAVVYPHSTLAASVPAATPAPEIMPLTLKVNGKTEQLEVDTRTTLLDTLRENLHLIGTKKGCDHGQCGACTVLVNGRRLNACLTLAVMHQGAEITTIEGLGSPDNLHPMQAAFIKHDGFPVRLLHLRANLLISSGAKRDSGRHSQSRHGRFGFRSRNNCR